MPDALSVAQSAVSNFNALMHLLLPANFIMV